MTTPVLRFSAPVPYRETARAQDRLLEARAAGQIDDVILLLQHRPVVTLGRRERDEHLLVAPEALRSQGIDFEVASRGGDVTFHGPGQWVVYPILKLDRHVSGPRGYLHQLEDIAIGTATAFGVHAFRREGKSGAWTDAGKLAAIGFRIRRGVTQHGMSFNVESDLSGFDLIVPCGLAEEPVTSLRSILGETCPTMNAVASRMITEMESVFGRPLDPIDAESGDIPAHFAPLLGPVR